MTNKGFEGIDIAWLIETTDRLRGIPSEDYPFPYEAPKQEPDQEVN